MEKVSIIILNYNGLKFNKDCIDSILSQSYKNFEILFVNNLSNDGSLEEVKKIYQKHISIGVIKIIENKKNYGFSEGNNIGVRHSDKNTKYICLLNNDTIVEKNWLEELIKCIKSDDKLGLVGSLILDKGHEEETYTILFKDKKMGTNNYIFESSFRDITEQEIKKGIFWATGIGGCSLLYKKDLIQDPFPSFYFAYGEDTYLSNCITLGGHKLALCTTSIVHHRGSGSFGKKTSLLKSFHGAKNQLCNILLFHTRINSIKLIPIYLLYQGVKICSSERYMRFKGFCKAIYRCICNREEIQKQKRYIKSIQKISNKAHMQKLSNKIFENIYFMKTSKYQRYLMRLLNTICKLYFILIGIRSGQEK